MYYVGIGFPRQGVMSPASIYVLLTQQLVA